MQNLTYTVKVALWWTTGLIVIDRFVHPGTIIRGLVKTSDIISSTILQLKAPEKKVYPQKEAYTPISINLVAKSLIL